MCVIKQTYKIGNLSVSYFECRKRNIKPLIGNEKAQIEKLESVFSAARKCIEANHSTLRIDLQFPYKNSFLKIDERFVEIVNYVIEKAIKKNTHNAWWHYEDFESLAQSVNLSKMLEIYNEGDFHYKIQSKTDMETTRKFITRHIYQSIQFTNPQQPKSTMPTYNQLISKCQVVFNQKLKDYGASWACMRMVGFVEQLLIKANRIRTIQESGAQKVADPIEGEFIGLYNYSLMACMKIENPSIITDSLAGAIINDYTSEKIESAFVSEMESAANLMQVKNHDYGQAWRMLSIAGITDFILTKIYRLRQIYANKGEVRASEQPIEIFKDIANYSIFALILLAESKEQ